MTYEREGRHNVASPLFLSYHNNLNGIITLIISIFRLIQSKDMW